MDSFCIEMRSEEVSYTADWSGKMIMDNLDIITARLINALSKHSQMPYTNNVDIGPKEVHEE